MRRYTRLSRGFLALGLVTMILLAATVTTWDSRPGGPHSSGVFTTFGWSNSLASAEAAFCLTPTGSNITIQMSSTVQMSLTNLTAVTSGSCSTAGPHSGIASVIKASSTVKLVQLNVVNNTTVIPPGPPSSGSNYTYVLTEDPIFGYKGFLQASENYTHDGSSFTASITSCFDSCGGGGGAGPSFGSTTVTMTTQVLSCPTPGGGTGPTVYWWDSVCFEKGLGVQYPHPDRVVYNVFASFNAGILGASLMHVQLGTTFVGSIGNYLVAGVIGVAIGGVIGIMIGGPWGGLAGAIVGGVISAALAYAGAVTYQDEAGAIWFWLDTSLVTHAVSVPWYVSIFGAGSVMAYLAPYVTQVRVGSAWLINHPTMTGP